MEGNCSTVITVVLKCRNVKAMSPMLDASPAVYGWMAVRPLMGEAIT